ncbi:MAG: T9SS type A sorting domain-containing protein [Bacteroidia bacterium]
MKNKLAILATCLLLVFLLRTPIRGITTQAFHSPEEIEFYNAHLLPPLDSGQYFSLPQNCKGCHGFDSLGLANVDLNGMDINLYDDWETSMMGLSAVDPLWRAKVSHEILTDTAHANELQTLCTSCHAPLGHFTAIYKGAQHYTMDDLLNDSLGQSGVSCHSCHSIKDSSTLGVLFTGQAPYDTTRKAYGPFVGPMPGPMQLYVGLTPVYGPHMSESKTCSPCHTLISNSVDLNGNPTGTSFVEQATYHEYLNSSQQSVLQNTCQTCHMPQIEDPIKIANGYTALPGRTPFNQHSFAGANSFMVQLIKDNKNSLGVTAPDRNFDSTLKAIDQLLKQNTLLQTTTFDSAASDTAYFSLALLNKAGHKFPSGYPSRRAVVQFIAVKANGDTLFSSGTFDNNFEVNGINTILEPHHDLINQPSQTQVYEMVMGDVNNDRTTVLERAYVHLKDNRIPPAGFTTFHSTYDTCRIVGDALTDTDFNRINGLEGSGQDIIHYHIPLNGYTGNINVYAHVYYQTLPPGFLSEMQTMSSAAIDTFLNLYATADKTPVLISGDTLENLFIPVGIYTPSRAEEIQIYPNPTVNGKINITNLPPNATVQLYTTSGQELPCVIRKTSTGNQLQLQETPGVYYLIIRNGKEKTLKKIIRQ